MLMSYTIYIILVGLLCLAAVKTAALARQLNLPPFLTTAIVLAGIIYVSCLLPGAFGILYTSIAYSICILACLALIFFKKNFLKPSIEDITTNSLGNIKLSIDEAILSGIGLFSVIPIIEYFRRELPARLLDPSIPLGWDTVSYHLPGFIEFWQNHTLWALQGPFQSYSYAFELIGNFLSHPFHTHWGLILTNSFALILLFAAIFFIAKTLTPCLPYPTCYTTSPWVPSAMLAIAAWSFVHPDSIGDIGKNDVFMTACLVSALGYLLHAYINTPKHEKDQMPLILILSVAVGLSVGTKPSALAFIPFFALASGIVLTPSGHATSRLQRFARFARVTGIITVMSVVLGGFWLIRNVLVFGHISPLSGAWELSLAANIRNPALYEIKRGSILFVLGLSAIFPAFYLIFASRRNSKTIISLLLLLSFHVVACAAFAITPHAIFHGSLQSSVWKLRLGMPLFVSAGLIFGLTITHACKTIWYTNNRAVQVIVTLAILVGLAYIPIHWHTHRPNGLPGYENIKGLPQTGIYMWLGSQMGTMRIYSAGLRPYGLYGNSWENILFYDLHSSGLTHFKTGIARIAAVVVQFRPDLILVSVDPHPYTGGPAKPEVVEWMRVQSNCFQEVYADDTVSAFKLKPEAPERLSALMPTNYCLHMGG